MVVYMNRVNSHVYCMYKSVIRIGIYGHYQISNKHFQGPEIANHIAIAIAFRWRISANV